MKIALIYPPTCDPTGPYLSVPILTPEQIQADAQPEKNPFHDYFAGELADLLSCQSPDVIGISLAFPGQVQPGYALAYTLRQALPAAHITVRGPAITQMLVHLVAEKIPQVLGPFHSAVLYEGEEMLLMLVGMLANGHTLPRVLYGKQNTDLGLLPPPDFEGMPLDKYLSPELVLPYDPTRECYWGKCAFCHYGLSSQGTAVYRQRPIDQIFAHLKQIENRWGCRTVYFSQDAFAPRTARELSQKLRSAGSSLQWATDMRPEPGLTPECCRDLKDGGALSMALGIETASSRLLCLIDKGVFLKDMQTAIKNLSDAGIAVEAMCFTEFPTETYDVFRRFADTPRRTARPQKSSFRSKRFAVDRMVRAAGRHEAEIWHRLIYGSTSKSSEFGALRFVQQRLCSGITEKKEIKDHASASPG